MISQAEAKALRDNALDTAYANATDSQSRTILALEIIDRLAGVRSFISGTFGFVRFPKYNSGAGANFKQVDTAQAAVVDNSKKVVAGIGTSLWSIALPVFIIGVILLVFYKRS